MTEEDLKEIKKVFKFMVKEDLVELDIQDQDGKLKLRRKEEKAQYYAPAAAAPVQSPALANLPRNYMSRLAQLKSMPRWGEFFTGLQRQGRIVLSPKAMISKKARLSAS